MAIPKKKSRLISVDGLEYRWLISFDLDAPLYRIVTIAVHLSTSPGTKLIVYPIGVDVNFIDYDRDQPITPKVVEEFIRTARDTGWMPTDSSGTFKLGDRSSDCILGRPAQRKRISASRVLERPSTDDFQP